MVGCFFIHLWVTVHTYTLGCAIWTTLVGVRLHPLGLQCSRGEMKYALLTAVCVCLTVPRHIATLLHGPGCELGEW